MAANYQKTTQKTTGGSTTTTNTSTQGGSSTHTQSGGTTTTTSKSYASGAVDANTQANLNRYNNPYQESGAVSDLSLIHISLEARERRRRR